MDVALFAPLAEVKFMKKYAGTISLLALVSVLPLTAVQAQTEADDFYRQLVNYRNGAVSLTFEQTPVPLAIYALNATTGFQIVIPAAPATKVVNLRLNQQPLEPAVRSLITSIGYQNFALIYDEKGNPNRAVVLSVRPEISEERAAPAKPESTVQPLSIEEQNKLQKDLEHWSDLKREERGRIEDRLKRLPQSEERDQLVALYGRQVLALTK
jgi:type II secretory pathway component GspD/PulD (secretin)